MNGKRLVIAFAAISVELSCLAIGHSWEFWGATLSLVTYLFFFVVQRNFPETNIRGFQPIDMIFFTGFILLVFNPALLYLKLIPSERFGTPIDWHYLNQASVVSSISFAGFIVGLRLIKFKVIRRHFHSHNVSRSLVLVILGITGLGIKFGSPSAFFNYLLMRSSPAESSPKDGLVGLLASLLPPLWTIGIVRLVDWASTSVAKQFVMASIALFPMTAYSYNRASFVITGLCIWLAIRSFKSERASKTLSAILVCVLALLFFRISTLRSEFVGTQGGRYSTQTARIQKPSVASQVEIYGGGLRTVGYAIAVRPTSLGIAATIPESLIGPLPTIGKNFRSQSGPVVLNRIIYRGLLTVDQILTTVAETYWAFGYVGNFIVFVLLGIAASFFFTKAAKQEDVACTYVMLLPAIWLTLSFFVSFSVLVQVFIYFIALPYIMNSRQKVEI